MKALLVAGLLLPAAACGIAPTAVIQGTTAVGVDASGHPVVLVAVCNGSIDTIIVNGNRAGLRPDQPNPVLAAWTTADPAASVATLDPRQPGVWQGSRGFYFMEDRTYIVNASSSDRDAETIPAAFTGSELAALPPDRVLVAEHQTWARRDLARRACK